MAFKNDALDAIQTASSQAKRAFLKAVDAGATKAQLAELNTIVSATGDAYWRAVSSALLDNNSVVTDIKDDLDATNTNVKALLTNLTNVVDLIKAVTEAVRLAAALVMLAAAV